MAEEHESVEAVESDCAHQKQPTDQLSQTTSMKKKPTTALVLRSERNASISYQQVTTTAHADHVVTLGDV